MVYIDSPRPVFFKGRERMTCHCISESLEELHDFAERLGLPRRIFQDKPGRPHYDLFDEYIDKALQLGARQVRNRELLLLLIKHYEKPKINFNSLT